MSTKAFCFCLFSDRPATAAGRLAAVAERLAGLEARKAAAVAGEDYDAAKAVKAEIDRVRGAAGASSTAGQSDPSQWLRRCVSWKSMQALPDVGLTMSFAKAALHPCLRLLPSSPELTCMYTMKPLLLKVLLGFQGPLHRAPTACSHGVLLLHRAPRGEEPSSTDGGLRRSDSGAGRQALSPIANGVGGVSSPTRTPPMSPGAKTQLRCSISRCQLNHGNVWSRT